MADADGEVTIDAILSTNKFDRQIAQLEKKMTAEEQKLKMQIGKRDKTQSAFNQQKREADELSNKYEKLSIKIKELQALEEKKNAGAILSTTELGNLDKLEAIRSQHEAIGVQYDKAIEKQTALNNQLDVQSRAVKQTENNMTGYQTQINGLTLQKHKADLDNVKDKVKGVGDKFQDTVKKAGRLALGIIGIRSAMVGLRAMSSQLASYDKQYATNLEYIKFVLSQAIAPILRGIVSIAMTLMNIIGAILKALFGWNLFQNSSVKDFENMKKSTGGVSKNLGSAGKSLKDMKKQLAGFDEANILQDNGDTASGGGGGGMNFDDLVMPNFDTNLPEWMQKIIDNKDLLISALAGIAAGLLAIKLGANALMGLGIGLVVFGIVQLVQDVIDFVKDPSWEKFAKILTDISIILLGIALILVAINATNPVAWILMLVAAIGMIIATIIVFRKQIAEAFKNAGKWLYNHVVQPIIDAFWYVVDGFKKAWEGFKSDMTEAGQWIYNAMLMIGERVFWALTDLANAISGVIEKVVKWIINTVVGLGKAIFDAITFVCNNISSLIENLIKFIIDLVIAIVNKIAEFCDWLANLVTTVIEKVTTVMRDFFAEIFDKIKMLGQFFVDLWNGFKEGARQSWEGIKEIFSKVADFFGTIFSNAWNKVKAVFSTGGVIFNGIKDGIVSAFKRIVNSIISGINRVISVPFNSINSVLRTIKNVSIAGMKPFDWVWTINVPQIPYLKTGGIINLPGRGVNLGGAFGGEAGREGVLPLTDQQAMAELGREIGKWIVVNATITNSMNGRLLSREIKRIENEQEFAFNS